MIRNGETWKNERLFWKRTKILIFGSGLILLSFHYFHFIPISISADQFKQTSNWNKNGICLLYTSPSPRDATLSRMPSSA